MIDVYLDDTIIIKRYEYDKYGNKTTGTNGDITATCRIVPNYSIVFLDNGKQKQLTYNLYFTGDYDIRDDDEIVVAGKDYQPHRIVKANGLIGIEYTEVIL